MIVQLKKTLLIIVSCSLLNAVHAQFLQKLDSLEMALASTTSSKGKVSILLKLSTDYKNNKPKKALIYAKQAYDLSKKENNQNGILNALITLANINWSLTDFKKTIELAEKAKKLAAKLNKEKELALSLQIEGLTYIELSNLEKSSEIFFNSLKIFEKLNDKQGIARLLSYIGSVYYYQLNYDKALEYYFRSLNIAKEVNDREGISRGVNNIAAVYETTKNYKKASKYFKDAIKMNRELGNKRSEGVNYMNLGTVNFKLKFFDKSIGYFLHAEKIFTEIQSKIMQARCHVNLANFYNETEDIKKSMEYALKAIEEGKEQDLKQIIHDGAEIIQHLYLKKNDKKKAFDYLQLQYRMKDSLLAMENRNNLAGLELQYDFDKKEQEKQIKLQRRNLFILVIIITLLLALIAIILFWIRSRIKTKNALLKQQQLEHELDIKKKELTTNVMALMKKNEVLSTISEKLINIKKQAAKTETKNAINKISRELQKTIDEEIFKEFELRFNQVHSDFYDKLLQRFPDLSPNEQRLCAFLRLGMTTKEISELTGQQTSSLETARYRLRKKLGITNSQTNLINFLSKV